MTTTAFRLSATIALLGLALVGEPAGAADMVFHATACTGESATANDDLKFFGTGIENRSTTSSRVIWCPADADTEGSGADPYGNVSGYDKSTSAAVSCVLYGMGDDGSVYYTLTESTSVAGTGRFSFHYHPSRYNSLNYAYRCVVPASGTSGVSSIIRYRFRP